MQIDAHQHFWQYDPAQYPWIPAGSPLQRDWLPADLAPLLTAAGLHASIAVQARQTLEESRWLLALADASPIIAGVVGWVDLRSAQVGAQLAELALHPKFRGVRHVVQDEPDVNFMLGADFQRGLSQLASFGLTYDLLIFPAQLPAAIQLVRRFPEQPFVLDHLAKPPIRTGALSPWREHIRELAQAPNVHCKVSGLITEAHHTAWQPAHFTPYLDIVAEAFGPERLMYGSDWPVCLLAGNYERTHRLAADYFAARFPAHLPAIFGANAARFYRIPG